MTVRLPAIQHDLPPLNEFKFFPRFTWAHMYGALAGHDEVVGYPWTTP